jgi:hypothetical protein
MSWASVAQQLVLAAGRAIIQAVTGKTEPKPTQDPQAARHGAAAGAAAHQASKRAK